MGFIGLQLSADITLRLTHGELNKLEHQEAFNVVFLCGFVFVCDPKSLDNSDVVLKCMAGTRT